jgi:pimeloyl-ACP methyl ester carboxylesterase
MSVYSIYRSDESRRRCMDQYKRMLADWPKPFEQTWVDTSYGRTHVLANGPAQAAALVLFHGQWSSALSWKAVVAALATRYRTYAIDQVNDVGLSEAAAPIAGRHEYVDWLRQVRTALGIKDAAVIGQSYGGYLATLFALSNPGSVGKLILLCPGLPILGRPSSKWAIHGLPAMIVPRRAPAVWLIKAMTVNGFDPSDEEQQLLVSSVMGLRHRVPIRPDINAEELQALDMPVMLLIGEREAMYDPEEAARAAKSMFPRVAATIVKGAGHMLVKDQKAAVLQYIDEFLAR